MARKLLTHDEMAKVIVTWHHSKYFVMLRRERPLPLIDDDGNTVMFETWADACSAARAHPLGKDGDYGVFDIEDGA